MADFYNGEEEEDEFENDILETEESKKEKIKNAFEKFGKSASKTASSGLKKAKEKSSEMSDELKKKKNELMKKTGIKSDKSGDTITTTDTSATAIFGIPLEDAVNLSQLNPDIQIPSIVQQCILFLNEHALEEEGIYRVPGSTSKVNNLKQSYNSGTPVDLSPFIGDPFSVAGLLKLYFRELPESILTQNLLLEFENIPVTESDDSERITSIQYLLQQLPLENKTVLSWLMNHLVLIEKKSDINKMTGPNLGVVFSACLNISPLLFKIFLSEAEKLFPDPFQKPILPPSPASLLRTKSMPLKSTNPFTEPENQETPPKQPIPAPRQSKNPPQLPPSSSSSKSSNFGSFSYSSSNSSINSQSSNPSPGNLNQNLPEKPPRAKKPIPISKSSPDISMQPQTNNPELPPRRPPRTFGGNQLKSNSEGDVLDSSDIDYF